MATSFLKISKRIRAKPKQSLYGHSLDTLKVCELYTDKNKEVLSDILSKYSINQEDFFRLVKIGCFFHDLGKATQKFQERLDDDAIMITHSLISYQILTQILPTLNEDLKKLLTFAVLGHHSQLHNNSFENITQKNIEVDQEYVNWMIEIFNNKYKDNISSLNNKNINLRGAKRKLEENIKEDYSTKNKVIYSIFLQIITLSDNLSSKIYSEKYPGDGEKNDKVDIDDDLIHDEDIKDLENKFIFDVSEFDNLKFVDELNELQKEVLERNTNNLIINADVGVGKTAAALVFGQKLMKERKINKIIFTLPTRFTSNNLFKDFFEDYNIPKDLCGIYHGEVDEFLKSLQEDNLKDNKKADEILRDEKHQALIYNKPFVISTVDHLLLSLLNGYKFSSRSFGNICSSMVVFDELHYYEEHTLNVIGSALKLLNELEIPHIIMTATLPDVVKDAIDEIGGYSTCTDYEIVTKANMNKDVEATLYKIEKLDKPMSCSDELNTFLSEKINENIGKKQIIFVNQVERCKWVYDAVNKICPSENVICYNSEFTKEDRIKKEKLIRLLFKSKEKLDEKDYKELDEINDKYKTNYGTKKGTVLISTQVSELSLNISSDVMYMEIAPIDSIIQRGGRLHRRGKNYKENGNEYVMYIFQVDFEDDNASLPYYTKEEKEKGEENILKKSFQIIEDGMYSFTKGKGWLDHLYKDEQNLSEPIYTTALKEDRVFGKKPSDRFGDEDKDIQTGIEIRKQKYATFDVVPFEFFKTKLSGDYKKDKKYFVTIHQWKFFTAKGKNKVKIDEIKNQKYWFIEYPYNFKKGLDFLNDSHEAWIY
ncbi:MAG: hypothetical protein CVT89_00510 [Candidatus Altiarchaeales archaeon HGW-Altiarchaeales-2]|nr:MAG: hypothetical protein CVT89_00510 [Candidatus Altiarchaeales archaeon HGW-Altiarchaeales-2]